MDCKEALQRNKFKAPTNPHGWNPPPTEQELKIVYSYAAYGATNIDIANVLGMSQTTLQKYFKHELDTGRATAKNTIAQRLYQIAVGKEAIVSETGEILVLPVKPNLAALIFLAKTRLGWKETQVVESHEMTSGVTIYLPDNGMKEDSNAREDE